MFEGGLMFGLATFAELIFADIGSPSLINTGWDKIPSPDCDGFEWKKIDRSCEEVKSLGVSKAEWTAIK